MLQCVWPYMQTASAFRWWRIGPQHDHRETATPTGTKLVAQASEKQTYLVLDQLWIHMQ